MCDVHSTVPSIRATHLRGAPLPFHPAFSLLHSSSAIHPRLSILPSQGACHFQQQKLPHVCDLVNLLHEALVVQVHGVLARHAHLVERG
jgi:hypothetical protein